LFLKTLTKKEKKFYSFLFRERAKAYFYLGKISQSRKEWFKAQTLFYKKESFISLVSKNYRGISDKIYKDFIGKSDGD
jgi:AMMECR1 domain-containing protein